MNNSNNQIRPIVKQMVKPMVRPVSEMYTSKGMPQPPKPVSKSVPKDQGPLIGDRRTPVPPKSKLKGLTKDPFAFKS